MSKGKLGVQGVDQIQCELLLGMLQQLQVLLCQGYGRSIPTADGGRMAVGAYP